MTQVIAIFMFGQLFLFVPAVIFKQPIRGCIFLEYVGHRHILFSDTAHVAHNLS